MVLFQHWSQKASYAADQCNIYVCRIAFNLFNAPPVLIRLSISLYFLYKRSLRFIAFLTWSVILGATLSQQVISLFGNMLSNNRPEEIRRRIDCLINIKLIKPITPVDNA